MSARFFITGDCAISVNFGNEISLPVNAKVRMLEEDLKKNPIEGIVETVPTYCSLMIHYKPEVIRHQGLIEALKHRLDQTDEIKKCKEYVTEIPILYGGEVGIDLEECAAFEKLSVEEFIKVHSESEYYVYMLGFAPGHAYTARFENPFHFKRRESPRISIPGNCVVVAQNLSNLIPFPQPCGWNIIGSVPVNVCDYKRENPFLVKSGEWVRYVPITENEFKKIRKQVLAGNYQCKRYERVVK